MYPDGAFADAAGGKFGPESIVERRPFLPPSQKEKRCPHQSPEGVVDEEEGSIDHGRPLKNRNTGMMECGILEYWNVGMLGLKSADWVHASSGNLSDA
jgi:hypothetical protein